MTWIGEKGSPMSKARAGPNKRVIQQVITVSLRVENSVYKFQNFAWEGTFSELKELDLKAIEDEVRQAGGANYVAQAQLLTIFDDIFVSSDHFMNS